MSATYKRTLSVNERMFVALDDANSVVANCIIIEGSGTAHLGQLQWAADQVGRYNPGSRLVLKGVLGSCRWVDSGVGPRVREVDGSNWDGFSPDGAPFLSTRLDTANGPTCEVLIVRGNPIKNGNPVRLIFRTHHGVMDGRGTMFWMEEIFRVLNGQSPVGSNSTLIDSELAHSIQKATRRPIKKKFLAPTGRAQGTEKGTIWRRIEIDGPIRNLIGRCAVLLAEEAWTYAEGPLLFGIPVDLRRHRPDLISTGNLSYAIYVEVNHGTTPEDVAKDISRQLKEKREGMLSPEDELFRYVPMKIISSQAKKIIDKRHQTGNYTLSGHLSNLGKLSLEKFQGGGFVPAAWWGIPPGAEYSPFFLGLTGYQDKTSLMATIPRILASDGRLDSALKRLAAGLRC